MTSLSSKSDESWRLIFGNFCLVYRKVTWKSWIRSSWKIKNEWLYFWISCRVLQIRLCRLVSTFVTTQPQVPIQTRVRFWKVLKINFRWNFDFSQDQNSQHFITFAFRILLNSKTCQKSTTRLKSWWQWLKCSQSTSLSIRKWSVKRLIFEEISSNFYSFWTRFFGWRF